MISQNSKKISSQEGEYQKYHDDLTEGGEKEEMEDEILIKKDEKYFFDAVN